MAGLEPSPYHSRILILKKSQEQGKPRCCKHKTSTLERYRVVSQKQGISDSSRAVKGKFCQTDINLVTCYMRQNLGFASQTSASLNNVLTAGDICVKSGHYRYIHVTRPPRSLNIHYYFSIWM